MSRTVKIAAAQGTRVFCIPQSVVTCVQVWKEMLERGKSDANNDTVFTQDGVF